MSHSDLQRPSRRFRWIIVTVIGCLVVISAAFAAGMMVRSPHEQAVKNARTEPTVTAKAEKRTVQAARTQAKGTLTLGRTWNVSTPTSDGSISVVTAVHVSVGDTVRSGTVLANVSGRPVIALKLPFDLYRDLSEGDTGDDVRALQGALRDLGLYKTAIDGQYGQSTSRAVEALYKRARVTPPANDSRVPSATAPAGAGTQTAQTDSDEAPGAKGTPTTAQTGERPLTPLPRSEILSLPSGTATVVSIASVNTHVSDQSPLAQLRSGEASVTARIGVGDKEAFASGTSVDVQAAADANTAVKGTVTTVSEFRQSDERNSLPGFDVTVSVADSGQLSDNQEVLVFARSGAGDVTGIAVPVTALRKDGGETFVTLKDKRRISVTVRIVGDGYAVLADSELREGDEVVVSTAS